MSIVEICKDSSHHEHMRYLL